MLTCFLIAVVVVLALIDTVYTETAIAKESRK
jgi:hypothetical protein